MTDMTNQTHMHAVLPARLIDRVPTAESRVWMKINDIQGEGAMVTREGEIEVHGVEWGYTTADPATSGSGRRRRAPEASDVVVTFAIDASVPHLVSAMMRGKSIDEVEISWDAVFADGPVEVLGYRLVNVIITSVQLAASKSMPAVQLALNCESFVLRYVELASDGTTGPSHEVEFDIQNPR